MLVLGIETSCDETAAAILSCADGKIEVLSEEISSQVDLHEQYGGVVPELASREHLSNLGWVVDTVLQRAGSSLSEVGLIAVTSGPGLKGCLLIGVEFAKGLALAHNIPICGVNHIEGHVLAPILDNPQLTFPYLALIVSGGHTEIHRVSGVGRYEVLARTLDDAAGEAFDKSANLLGLSYPGGPKLAALADRIKESDIVLPKVMREGSDFSFSGLKTAIARTVREFKGALDEDLRCRLAFSVQGAIVDALIFKLKAATKETKIAKIAVSGGVAANSCLRRSVSELPGVQPFFPSAQHSTDNAAMIAFVGWMRRYNGLPDCDLVVRPRWPVESVLSG